MAETHKPVCITFAGVVGSSKTPIATYLSWNLGLPICSNDAVRSEVVEDLLHFDEDEYQQRKNARMRSLMESKKSFLCDVSVDRRWKELREQLNKNGYSWFLISLDLSKELVEKLYAAKEYAVSSKTLDQLLDDHEQFLAKHDADIALHITDETFLQRLSLSLEKVKNWLAATKRTG